MKREECLEFRVLEEFAAQIISLYLAIYLGTQEEKVPNRLTGNILAL